MANVPNDLDNEQAILGAALTEERAIQVASEIVDTKDFYREAHRLIFGAMQAVMKTNKPTDLVTVSAELRRRKELEEVGGGEYLTALMNEVPSVGRVAVYADTVKQCAVLRRFMELGGDLQEKAQAGKHDPVYLLEWLDSQSADIHLMHRKAGADVPELVTYDDIGEAIKGQTWTWQDWLPNGCLSLLIAPEGTGKTYAAMALGGCITEPRNWPDASPGPAEPGTVLWLDYEAGEGTLHERLLKDGLTKSRFIAPEIGEAGSLGKPEAPDILQAWLRKAKPALVVIDSLRYALPGVDENDSRIASYIKPLAEIAREADVPILILHHTTKGQSVGRDLDCFELDTQAARGSSTITALTRSVMALDKPDPGDDTLRLHVVKANFCQRPDPVGFAITDTGQVEWCEAPYRAVELNAIERAIEFLRVELQGGGKRRSDLVRVAEAQGISTPTLDRAAKKLPVARPAHGLWGLPSAKDS